MKITQALINSCLIALSQASFEIMRVYAQDFEVTVKEDGSPVTIADRLSSQIITQHLIPYGYPVLSEEDQIPAYSIRKNWETFWLIDPLDGTKEFVNRTGEFCICVTLIHKQKPIFGMICSPLTNETIYGHEQIGVWKGKLNEPNSFQRVEALTGIAPIEIRVLHSKTFADTSTFLSAYNLQNMKISYRSKGSALKFMDLATNQADVYFRKGPTMEWDTAAGQLLLELQGGCLVDLNNHSLCYNKENLLNPSFIAKTSTFALL